MGSSVSSNIERKPSRRPSKKDFLIQARESISQIRRQIELDPNLEDHEGYNEKLSEYSQLLLEIKTKSKNQKIQLNCNRMLNEINACHALIRETAEIRERNLDTAAIESNSFISQDIYRPHYNRKTTAERIRSLSTIESKIQSLDYEIRRYVLTNDIRNLIILEKKVDILYRDLDEVKAAERTQMADKKAKLAEKLIKFRNKINVVKRKAGQTDANDGQALSKPQLKTLNTDEYSLSILAKVEKELNELKQRCSSFEGCAEDESYKELYSQIRQQYTTLSNLAVSSEKAQHKLSEINSIIRKTLAQLSVKARENEKSVALNLSKIANIDQDIDLCKQKLEEHFGSTSHLAQYSHKLVELNRKIFAVTSNNPKVTAEKNKVLGKLEEVQDKYKAKITDSDKKNQVLAKVKVYESSWRELTKIIDETLLRESKPIMDILGNVADSMSKFLKEKGDFNARMMRAHSTEFMDQLMDEIASNTYKKSRSAENLRKNTDEVIYSNYLVHQQLMMEINSKIAQLEGKISNFQRTLSTMQGTKLSEEYKMAKSTLDKYRSEIRGIRPYEASIVQNKEKLLKVLDEAARQLEYKAEINSVRTPLVVRSYELPKPLNLSDQKITSNFDKNLPLTPTTPKRTSIFNSNPNISQLTKSVSESRASIGEPSVAYSIPTPWLKKLDDKLSTNTLSSMYETKLKQIDQALVQMPKKIDLSRKVEESVIRRELETLQGSLSSIPDLDENLRHKKQRIVNNVDAMFKYLDNKVVERSKSIDDISTRTTLLADEVYPVPQKGENQAANESLSQLEQINREFEDLAKEIDLFHGTKDDTEFCVLDETLLALMLKVDKIKTYRIPAVKEQRKTILQKMNKYNAILEEKAKSQNQNLETTDEIIGQINSIRTKVANLGNAISSFRGQRSDAEYQQLDQNLLDFFLELDEIDPHDRNVIKEAKQTVLREIQEQMQVLEGKVASDDVDGGKEESVGTYV